MVFYAITRLFFVYFFIFIEEPEKDWARKRNRAERQTLKISQKDLSNFSKRDSMALFKRKEHFGKRMHFFKPNSYHFNIKKCILNKFSQ